MRRVSNEYKDSVNSILPSVNAVNKTFKKYFSSNIFSPSLNPNSITLLIKKVNSYKSFGCQLLTRLLKFNSPEGTNI